MARQRFTGLFKPKLMHWKTYHHKLNKKMLELNEYSDILVYRKWGALI